MTRRPGLSRDELARVVRELRRARNKLVDMGGEIGIQIAGGIHAALVVIGDARHVRRAVEHIERERERS